MDVNALAAFALELRVVTFVLTQGIKHPLPNTIHPKERDASAGELGRITVGLEDILLTPQTFGLNVSESTPIPIVLVRGGNGWLSFFHPTLHLSGTPTRCR